MDFSTFSKPQNITARIEHAVIWRSRIFLSFKIVQFRNGGFVMINKGCYCEWTTPLELKSRADIYYGQSSPLVSQLRSAQLRPWCCCLLAPVDLRPRCLLQNWDLLSSARTAAAQTQLIGRTLHACSDLWTVQVCGAKTLPILRVVLFVLLCSDY